ncbi:methyl-accepting chemotaxis protein [Vibrio pectenicida]|uniref:Methyl-accepting chemotaxis protein n=1 Tax=Vibrio pectenicida TaxID=62763 RepID=A0A427U4G5_9VIBR|nr:methyl-accepting chemotaxis protein [Vibrio pectenicida]RSD31500.1 methyl-accepting chemotaxis protein [Vibrio pectenicida]
MSLQLRFILAILGAIALSLGASTSISTYLSMEEMRSVLLQQSQEKLTATKELVRAEVENYFSDIEGQITSMANNVATREAAVDFTQAFSAYEPIRKLSDSQLKTTVNEYYTKEFSVQYSQLNQDKVKVTDMFSGLSDLTYNMQFDFIADNPNPLGNKDNLTVLENSSRYAREHEHYHDTFRQFLQTFGYYDIFIVNPKSGHIVYSVFKELDFATSLKNGPYTNSGIGQAFQQALSLKKGEVFLTDFAPYLPSYNAPASFMSTPIVDKGNLVGVLIFQMPIDELNKIMTQGGQWKDRGFGNTGETYLVGSDGTLRNESRFLIEDKSAYLDTIRKKGISAAKDIELKNTSISLQPVNTPGVTEALRGINSFDIFEDYRGVPVLSAYGPVKVPNHTWAIMSEVDEKEAFAPKEQLGNYIISAGTATTIVMIIVFWVISIVLVRYLLKPLSILRHQFYELNSGDANLNTRLKMSNIPEFDSLTQSVNTFIEQIKVIIDSVKTSTDVITHSSKQLSKITDNSYKAAEDQTLQASNVTESMIQFNEALLEVSQSSATASDYTHQCRESALLNSEQAQQAAQFVEKTGHEVQSSAETLSELQNEVERINNILKVITGIAEQTNLLALNAAIEAARAGESGRGFAVVADEVRQLATKTQNSTVDIQSNISRLSEVTRSTVNSMERSNHSAQEGINLVNGVSVNLRNLSAKIDELATINATVAAATEEQKVSCDEINRNISNVKDSSGDLRNASEEIDCAALGLAEVSGSLQDLVNRFKVA